MPDSVVINQALKYISIELLYLASIHCFMNVKGIGFSSKPALSLFRALRLAKVMLHNCRTWATVLCIVLVWLPLGVSSLALMSSGLGHTAFVGVIVICLCLAGACSAFCSLGLVAMACLLLLVVLLALLMLTGLRGCAYLAMLVLLGMRGT